MAIDIPRNEHLEPQSTPIKVGERAPDFTLLNHDREPVSLKELLAKGGDVVLSFYPFDFTGVCGKEMACYTNDFDRFADKGATVVGISCDSFAAHNAWRKRDNITITLLSDLRREVCKGYGFYWEAVNAASRGTAVIGADGVVKWVSAREPSQAVDNEQVLEAIG